MNLDTSLKDEICRYAALNDINKVILFGSRARGTNKERSDVDLAVSGGNPRKLVISPVHKTAISAWTNNGLSRVTLTKEVKEKKLVQAIDVYESDFGKVDLIPSRYLIAQTATDPITGESLNFDLSGVSLLLDPSYLKLAWLRPFTKEKLPKLADATAGVIKGEVTLECRGEQGQAIINGTLSGT